WQDVLGLDRVGVTDDFFRIGGDSILAIKLVSLMNLKLSAQISVKDIFRHHNIFQLSKVILDTIGNFKYQKHLITDPSKDAFAPFELTNVQQAYLYGRLNTVELGNISTHIYTELHFCYFDINKFEIALNRLILRHGSLRTIFNNEKQSILEEVPYYKILNSGVVGQNGLKAIRNCLSIKVYNPNQWPLFDFQVSKFNKDIILHISFDGLIMDGNSLMIFFRELSRLYNSNDVNQVVLPELKINFKDYILKYLQARSSQIFIESKQYWLRKSEEYDFDIQLPMRLSSGDVIKPKFARLTRKIPQTIWQLIEDKAKEYNLGITSVILYAYGCVLSKWSGKLKLCVNLTLFNRLPLHEQINDILGDFTALELFNFKLEGKINIYSGIHKIHSELWNDIQYNLYDGIDFQRLIRKKQEIPQNRALSPIVLTSMLGNKPFDISLNGYIGPGYSITQTSQVFLDNKAYQTEEGFVAEWDYVEQLFAPEIIRQMHSDYCYLIEYLAKADWKNDLPQIPLSNRDISVIEGANNYRQKEVTETLVDMFLLRLIKSPDIIAVVDSKGNYTYKQLGEYSYRIAGFISDIRLTKTNQLIGVLSNKGYEQIISVLGIMRSGNPYLPLHVDWPIGRLDEILEEGGVDTILVSNSQFNDLIKNCEIKSKYRWLIIEEILNYEPKVLKDQLPKVNIKDIAYVIYTSGSTGKPKGVTISHKGAVNTIKAINRKFRINEKDKILALSELSFDLSVYDIFGLLATGGSVIFPDQEKVKEPRHWFELIKKYDITLWNTVPQLMQLLVDYANDIDQKIDSLRVVLMSGDWIPIKLPYQIKTLSKDSIIMSLGGATEGSIWSIWYEIINIDPSWHSIPYGRAMPNQKMYILNEHEEHCSIGITGNIYIGGDGVAINYWNDQVRTKESFIKHNELGKLYKTGDLGKWNIAGYIEFEGRKDNQVKLNGYRVELEEISSKLVTIDEIDKSLVIIWNNRLIAYLVLIGTEMGSHFKIELQAEQFSLDNYINTHLKEYLPTYMIPSSYIILDEIPLTKNGKVDYKNLPKPEIIEDDYVAPVTKMEKLICKIWQDVLELDRVGIKDDFFRAGGDSIAAIKVSHRMSAVLNFDVSVANLFKYSTIYKLLNTNNNNNISYEEGEL
ncbi:amino acid adenylation domain-containing protein, partial [uncultured Aquimarina sp.]|uniref:amino acid adenylation domain-containing protein n=1 Tax=uncultured Aquimarina sp. TaxID=575652 RepID=UPI0026058C3F